MERSAMHRPLATIPPARGVAARGRCIALRSIQPTMGADAWSALLGCILNGPAQDLVEPLAEREVVDGIDVAVAVGVDVAEVAGGACGLVEGAAEREVVDGIVEGSEIVAVLRRGVDVAEEAMDDRRRVGGHVDAALAER